MQMNWKYFVGASILAVGLLIKVGAPVVPIAVGLAGAAYFNYRKQRRPAPLTKKT